MKNQRGQILVIVLLVMLVGLTMGLALFARTTTDIAISNRVAESTRAFGAAEAGIEQALQGTITQTQTAEVVPGSGISYTTTVADIGGTDGVFNIEETIERGDTTTVWLVNHDATGNLVEAPTYQGSSIDLCWNSAGSNTSAVVVTLLYQDAPTGQYRAAQAAYDPQSDRENNFQTPDNTGGGNCGGAFTYRTTLTFASFGPVASSGINPAVDTLLALRIMTVYENATVAVDPPAGVNLPKQGQNIVSDGVAGTTNRRIEVFKYYQDAPGFFDAPLFIGQGVEEN